MAQLGNKRRWIYLLAGVALLASVFVAVSIQGQTDNSVTDAVLISVVKQDITQQVLAAAVVKPKVTVKVGAQVTGQISQVHVQVGQVVRQGDVLVTIDPAAARNDVKRAQADIKQQELTLQSRHLDLEQARRVMQRQKRLLANEATSQLDYETAKDNAEKLAIDLRIQASNINELKVELANSQLKLNHTKVTAPLEGTVISIDVQVGQTVNAQNQSPTLLSIAQLDTMTVWARVPEADVLLIQMGQEAAFKPLGEADKGWRGRVQLVRPVPEKINGATYYVVMFDVANQHEDKHTSAGKLMIDMSGLVEIIVAQHTHTLTLAVSALAEKLADGQFVVYVPNALGQPIRQKVSVGLMSANKVQILGGLGEGDHVYATPPLNVLGL